MWRPKARCALLTWGAWTAPSAVAAALEENQDACFQTFVQDTDAFGSDGIRVKLNHPEQEQMPWDQLQQLSAAASLFLARCRNRGGRLWSVSFPTNTSGTSQKLFGEVTWGLPMSMGFCAPSICHKRQIPFLVEEFLSDFMGVRAELNPARMHRVELGSWEDFQIQFAIIGLDGCGTTSACRNLGLHPQIKFSESQIPQLFEDTFFTWYLTWYLLPPKHLQRHWLGHNKALQRSASAFGIYNAILWEHPLSRLALHHMNARPVLVVCSPARWLASRLVRSRSSESVSAADMIREIDHSAVSHLKEWRRLFGERLLVIHQDTLLQRETYDAVSAFLGLGPLPAATKVLGRFQVRGQHWKSALCRSTDQVLLDRLNRTLRPLMLTTAQLLLQSHQDVPSSHWQLQGHCSQKLVCPSVSRDEAC